MEKCQILIIGAGVVGLALSRELLNKGYKDIVLIEKEKELGVHSSGHNSGVLHAGIYYPKNTAKAKACLRGRELLTEYVIENKLSYFKSGKVIVCQKEELYPKILDLYKLAQENEVPIKLIDEKELKEIEPEAVTFQKALHSPGTSVINAMELLNTIKKEILNRGVKIYLEEPLLKVNFKERFIETKTKKITYDHAFNCAGVWADLIATQFGVEHSLTILPFKGNYRKINNEYAKKLNGSIYPVPDPKLPFLGVHFTKLPNGEVWVGPTATPQFSRFGFNFLEFLGINFNLAQMILLNRNSFRNLVLDEIGNYFPNIYLERLQRLAPQFKSSMLENKTKFGTRAQLYDTKEKKLVMDYMIQNSKNSTHILNVISPGLTSSFALAEMILKESGI